LTENRPLCEREPTTAGTFFDAYLPPTDVDAVATSGVASNPRTGQRLKRLTAELLAQNRATARTASW
jgi:hypothetical protein